MLLSSLLIIGVFLLLFAAFILKDVAKAKRARMEICIIL